MQTMLGRYNDPYIRHAGDVYTHDCQHWSQTALQSGLNTIQLMAEAHD